MEKFMELYEVFLPDYFKGVHKYYWEHGKYLSNSSNFSYFFYIPLDDSYAADGT